MADKVHLELVSPEKLLSSAKVAMVVIPGREGDFAVMPGHAPVISTMRPGVLEIYEEAEATPDRVFIRGGFADIARDRLTVLAEEAVRLEELDKDALNQRIENLKEDVEDTETEEERAKVQEVLDQMMELANVTNL